MAFSTIHDCKLLSGYDIYTPFSEEGSEGKNACSVPKDYGESKTLAALCLRNAEPSGVLHKFWTDNDDLTKTGLVNAKMSP